ncbi:MAG: ABC transporter substrate-binding protein [Propioniciclava sp.]
MHITKRLATCGLIAGLTVSLAACGGSTAPVGDTVEGDIAYAFWGTPARAEKVDAVISLFQAEYPDATVQPEVADYLAYIERLTVRAAGNDLGCATGTQTTFLSQYAQNSVLRPLDDLIEGGQIDVSHIPEDVLAAGQIDGQQYMIPTGTFARVLGYNETLAADAGAAEPSDDLTWDEYAAWLRSMQPNLPDGVYAGENEGGTFFTLTSWVIGHGEQMFDGQQLGFSKETLADYFEFWLSLADDGAVVPPSMISEQSGALELTPIATGEAVAGTRDIPHLYIMEQALAGSDTPSPVGWFSMPSESPTQAANVLGSNGISIPESCTNVATAAAFIDFFANNTEAAIAFQSDNGILTNLEGQDALLADADTPEGVKRNVSVLRELTDANDLATTTYPAGLSTLTNELLRLYQAVAFDEMTVTDAVDAFFVSAEDALD